MRRLSELLELVFSDDGLLASHLDAYEQRPGQKAMAAQVLEAYEENKLALIEAGTGIGKSLAYLVPAIFWALQEKEKTVISTHTIALQEQLLEKDIPFLLETLDLDLKAVLVKGMGNYICLRKLSEMTRQQLLFDEDELEEIEQLEAWAKRTEDGTRSDLNFSCSRQTWDKVKAEADSCNKVRCPFYKECHFFKAREEMESANLLVVNHALFFADLVQRTEDEEKAILPSHGRIVLDEAHHLEGVALESLSLRVDRLGLLHQLNRFWSDKEPRQSRLGLLIDALPKESAISKRIAFELPADRRRLLELIEEAFAALDETLPSEKEELKWRLKGDEKLKWQEPFEKLKEAILSFVHSLEALCEELSDLPITDKLSAHIVELGAIGRRLEEKANIITRFFSDEKDPYRVRWIEKRKSNLSINEADLNVASYLKEHLFSSKESISLCSATLATEKNFSFVKKRLGIEKETLTEEIYPSPFDYENRSLFLVPTDMPDPKDDRFIEAACDAIVEAIHSCDGNAFVLFTSYEMLRIVFNTVEPLLEGYECLRQGDAPRNRLLSLFKEKDRSVLFGTDTFWEGIDVAGDQLRCVIIAKLPFKVPTDPLIQAQSELVEEEGKSSFFDFAVPQAIVKFKQGFGRLIRNKKDRGCVVCLDKRVVTKGYGKGFINSLPPCRTYFAPAKDVFKEMKNFYSHRI